MTVFERIVPFLVGALLIATAVVGALCARVELRLAKRRRVTLDTYRQNNHLFYISKDTTVAVVTGGVALFALVLMIICLCSPLIRTYAVALALLLAVNGAVVWLSLSRSKCARDVRAFDSYYVKVENLLSNKERTLANIKVNIFIFFITQINHPNYSPRLLACASANCSTKLSLATSSPLLLTNLTLNPKPCNSLINTRNDSGIPGSGIGSPSTIAL